jgi:dinuclear metal center YbgI/SA1388 family protein
MLVADLASAMASIAPPHLAEPWDNVGLLVGDVSRPLVGPVLLTIDLTDAVVDEAVESNTGAIVAYHPPIFTPLRRLDGSSPAARRLLRVIERGIAVHSPHTALDAVPGGVTDWLIAQACPDAPGAQATGLALEPLAPSAAPDPDQTHKIVVFLPRDHAVIDRVRHAMADAGAGRIGHYEQCAFAAEGVGTFRGGDASNPAIGTPGRLESVNEARLEMVCGEQALPAIVAAIRATHPYEEPAFDLFQRCPTPRARGGAGRMVTLDPRDSPAAIAQRLQQRLGATVSVAMPRARPATHDPRPLRLAAVPGSGGSLLDAAVAAGATCFLTGEMKHHEVLGAIDRGCAVILAGHTETERGYLPTLAARLNAIHPEFAARPSAADAPILRSI